MRTQGSGVSAIFVFGSACLGRLGQDDQCNGSACRPSEDEYDNNDDDAGVLPALLLLRPVGRAISYLCVSTGRSCHCCEHDNECCWCYSPYMVVSSTDVLVMLVVTIGKVEKALQPAESGMSSGHGLLSLFGPRTNPQAQTFVLKT